MKLTCIMPAYNEELLIEESVTQTITFWKLHEDVDFQLIVVNDGSNDRTPEILKKLQNIHKELTIVHQENTGKGGAVKHGVEKATDRGLLYIIDADMPFSLEDQLRVVQHVTKKTPVVYGSRVKVSGIMQSNSIARAIASLGLGLLNKFFLGIRIKDNQCGLKAFQADLAKEIFEKNQIGRWGFDLFISSILTKHKIKIGIEPVTLLDEQRESRVRVVSASFQLLKDIIEIKQTLGKINLSQALLAKYQ